MEKMKVKLGLAPTRRNVFSKEDSQKYKKLIEKKLKELKIDFVNIDWLNPEGLLFSSDEVPKVIDYFRKNGVDAVFSPHCNFGTEDAVALLAKEMGKPFLLWGPRDEDPLPDGSRLRDTQCGLFATSKILRRLCVPFSYIVNSRVDSKVFENGLKNFISASSAVKAFKSAKILQISTRPAGFWTVMVNEGELLEKFGIKVVPTTLSDIVLDMNKRIEKKDTRVKNLVAEIKRKVDTKDVSDDALTKMAGLKISMQESAMGAGASAIALQCWNALQSLTDIMPCFVDGLLTGEGIPVSCETDIHGAITSVILQSAGMNLNPTFFADLTIRHPKNENGELLWHCGPFPLSLAKKEAKPKLGGHFILPSGCKGLGEWEIKGGDITLARFDGDNGNYYLCFGHAKGISGPYTRGTYLWVEVNDWPLWEEKIIRGPYIHHIVGVHDKLAPVLYEFCRFVPGLTPDPVSPTESEIQKMLRG